jgi:replicative DNA helicase
MNESTPFQVIPGYKGQLAKALGGRPLPQALESEEQLLSCCMLDGAEMIPRCRAAGLKPEAFYSPAHGVIFATILHLYDAQAPTESSCVCQRLQDTRELDAVGGYAAIGQISRSVPTLAQASYFLQVVREQWIVRELIRRGTRLVEECYARSGESLADLVGPHAAFFDNALARITTGGRPGDFTLAKRIEEVIADVRLRAEGKEDRSGWVTTGFRVFDDTDRADSLMPFNYMDEDGVVLVGGGSSFGKSVLLRQWAGHALRQNQTVVAYTLETTVKGFIRALAANWAGINLRTPLRTPRDLIDRFEEHARMLQQLADRRLFVFQQEPGTTIRTIEDLVRHIRSFVSRHGSPHLITLDYVQLLNTDRRTSNREEQMAIVSSALQTVQRELGCVLLMAAQLNEAGLKEMRKVVRDADGRIIHRLPCRGDLRESQSLYHAADCVIFLHQPVEDSAGRDQTSLNVESPEMWLVQDKRRNGIRGTCRTVFQRQFLRFVELPGAGPSGQKAAQPEPKTTPETVNKASYLQEQV